MDTQRFAVVGRRKTLWTVGLVALLVWLGAVLVLGSTAWGLASIATCTLAFAMPQTSYAGRWAAFDSWPGVAIGMAVAALFFPAGTFAHIFAAFIFPIMGALAWSLLVKEPTMAPDELRNAVRHVAERALAKGLPLTSVTLHPEADTPWRPMIRLRTHGDISMYEEPRFGPLRHGVEHPFVFPVRLTDAIKAAEHEGALWQAPTSAHGRLAMKARLQALHTSFAPKDTP